MFQTWIEGAEAASPEATKHSKKEIAIYELLIETQGVEGQTGNFEFVSLVEDLSVLARVVNDCDSACEVDKVSLAHFVNFVVRQ